MTVAPPPADLTIGRQGHYAGGASRLIAFVIDLVAIWGLYVIAVAVLSFASQLISGKSVNLSHHQIPAVAVLVAWGFIYFSYQWALSGKTVGMAIFGLQVVAADGAPVSTRRAMVRTLALPLSFLLFGLGLLGILVQRERRALHDLIARTAVVYAWDARAARLRWLSRQEALPLPAPLTRASGRP